MSNLPKGSIPFDPATAPQKIRKGWRIRLQNSPDPLYFIGMTRAGGVVTEDEAGTLSDDSQDSFVILPPLRTLKFRLVLGKYAGEDEHYISVLYAGDKPNSEFIRYVTPAELAAGEVQLPEEGA